jgi:SAM-dependent methyltransferase
VTDVAAVRRKYRRNAALFDAFECLPFRRLRQRAVELLQPSAGATVLDLGCGTGLSFPLLTHFGDGSRLWAVLARHAGQVAVEEHLARSAYVATVTTPPS